MTKRISKLIQMLCLQVYDEGTDKFYPMAGDSQGRVITVASSGWRGKVHGTPDPFPTEGDYWYDLDLHAWMGWDGTNFRTFDATIFGGA
jgi:hypothetical protein